MKYKIEGDIDFFKELSELKNEISSNNALNVEKENIHTCLITCEPLTDFFVVMSCGHKFNYIPSNSLFVTGVAIIVLKNCLYPPYVCLLSVNTLPSFCTT